MPGVPDARCSWLWPNTTPWLPLDRHWPWPRAHPAESYTVAAADITTSTPAGLTTRTCYESRHFSCTDTPKCRTTETSVRWSNSQTTTTVTAVDIISKKERPNAMTIAADATLVTIPCFSGAPWDAEQLEPLTGRRPVRTM